MGEAMNLFGIACILFGINMTLLGIHLSLHRIANYLMKEEKMESAKQVFEPLEHATWKER